jgi:FMN phosphatase YigB (HAD superfamily)
MDHEPLDLRSFIRDVPDFPKDGILFKDITPLLQDPVALRYAVDRLQGYRRGTRIANGNGLVAALYEALKARGVPVYAITNWSAETFPPQKERFAFLSWFDGIVVSGVEGVIKPDPRIFRILFERHRVATETAVFIDDVAANADAASELGIHGIHFRDPEQLRRELAAVGILNGR